MYFLMIAAILHQYEEQPLATAEEQQRCMTLLAHPEDAHEVQPLTFRIDPLMGQRDYVPLDNIPGGILCSQRFLALLMSVKADCFVFPALLRDLGQEQERAASYHFVVPRRYDQTIDWERSESWVETESESGGHSLTKLVLTEECEAQQIPLFRPEHTLLTVVHDHLRTTVEQAKLVGVAFAPLTALYSPHQGVRLLELERLLRKRPMHARRWIELGDIQISLLRFQDALLTLDRALTLDPTSGRAWYLRGLALNRLGHKQEALEAYQQATLFAELGAWQQTCKLLRQLGRTEEALSLIEHSRTSLWETGRPFWCELGEIYVALGRDEDALVAFERALLLPGTGRDATFCGKGAILFRLGRYEEALATYRAGLEPHPLEFESKIRELWRGEITVLRVLGRLEEAARSEQKLQELEQERAWRMHVRPL